MNPSRVIPSILLCVSASLPLSAHADVTASSILDVNNLRIVHADGTPYTVSDFAEVSALNQAAIFYRTGTAIEDYSVSPTSEQIDIPVTCSGSPCPVTSENNFSPLPGSPGGYFSNVDQRQLGSLLAGDLHLQARSDASARSTVISTWGGNATTEVAFRFRLNQTETMTFEFDATPYLQLSRPTAANSPLDQGRAASGFVISIVNLRTEEWVLFLDPDELFTALEFSSQSQEGNLIYDPGTTSFSLNSGVLYEGQPYELRIGVAAATYISAVPEPSSLAMLLTGLGALLARGWRRKLPGTRLTSG